MIYECALGSEIGALKELMVVVVYSVSVNCAVARYIARAEVTVYSILVGYLAFGGKCCERVGRSYSEVSERGSGFFQREKFLGVQEVVPCFVVSME